MSELDCPSCGAGCWINNNKSCRTLFSCIIYKKIDACAADDRLPLSVLTIRNQVMSDFRYLPSLKSQDSLRETQQIDNEKYRSIFTYNTDLGPSTFSSSNSQKSKDQKKSNETTITNMKNNSNMAYSKLKQKEDEEMGSHRSAFDYKSIFTYSNPGDNRAKHQAFDYSEPSSNAEALQTELEGLSGKIVSNLALIFSYILVFFTLPISIWFCFKNLPQWERIVIYRMGKLQGVKGPGNIFLIPWLDSCSKLDLRTQLICHPLKQVYFTIHYYYLFFLLI